MKRVFQYHGAEHMTIHALEHGDPLNVNAVRRYPTAHQRCGTEFLVVVIILSILAFSLIGRQEPLVMIVSRILLIPVIAAVGYEILRFGARHRGNPLVRALFLPGIWVQAITTKQPTDDMIEVAIVSMEEALRGGRRDAPRGCRRAGTRAARVDRARRRALGPARLARARGDATRGLMTDGDRPAEGIDAKLLDVAGQYDALNDQLARPEVASDPDALRRIGKELAQLEPVVAAYPSPDGHA